MRYSKGFTLIELVACIVIIAVLAVTAYPRMVGMQKEARIAVLLGAREALRTVNDQVYIKAVLQSEDKVKRVGKNIDLDGDGHSDIAGYFGYINYVTDAEKLAGFDPLKLKIRTGSGFSPSDENADPDGPYFRIGFKDKPVASNLCYVEVYYPKQPGDPVTYGIQTRDC
uniref:type II secretion system protein n=1 Tax=Thaumasiovibrio occultus TaxID=1891184 RepID=UPI000B35CFCE|nr:prepilin-type N-terminal cleavage/methylation domain-containing protein [Thaumasiovibrio occultus]